MAAVEGNTFYVEMPNLAGPVVDLSGHMLQKLDPCFPCPNDVCTLILDNNQIIKLEHLEKFRNLMQLSVANNRLVRMMGVAKLTSLRVLNLPNNSIGCVEGLKDLVHLEWLNLAGNNLKSTDHLNNASHLQHLDLSENNISQIGDLSKLTSLQTLLLHGNMITTLRSAPAQIPHGLLILSLAENEIRDLNEVSFLASFPKLEQLSVMNNPCVMTAPSLPGFDYRPYLISWCLNIRVLDGYVVSQKESLKAEWLYSQGKGRSFRLGQHVQLVQYLASVCPLSSTPALQSAEDAKLEKILNKQRLHQRQLMQQHQNGGFPSTTSRRSHYTEAEYPSADHSELKASTDSEPMIKVNSWIDMNTTEDNSFAVKNMVAVSGKSERDTYGDIFVEDLQRDEDKLNCSLLPSESAFMPDTSELSPGLEHRKPEHTLVSEGDTALLEFESKLCRQSGDSKKQTFSVGLAHQTKEGSDKDRETEKKNKQSEGFPSPSLNLMFYTNSVSGYLPSTAVVDCHQPMRDFTSDKKSELIKVCDTSSSVENEPLKHCIPDEHLNTFQHLNKAATRIQACWRGFSARNFNCRVKDIRYEIRLQRMQEHIVILTNEVARLKKKYQEERIQRLVQEEAIKFLWNEVRSLQKWHNSMNQQSLPSQFSNTKSSRMSSPMQFVSATNQNSVPVNKSDHCNLKNSNAQTWHSVLDFPDSGFHSSNLEPSSVSHQSSSDGNGSGSSGTGSSVETIKHYAEEVPQKLSELDIVTKPLSYSDHDNSLLQQYLNSVQQLEDADDGSSCSDRTTSSRFRTADISEQDSLLENISNEVSCNISVSPETLSSTPKTSQGLPSQASEMSFI
ncbi:centrosomal protein of 97 kDa isoform X2 [Protopterus annectens]|uniref:centrosomal protein of 97 kDa isoform X2 n=1 Tax=Protopterus annectens TaxID=7888 RepID=UPI001CFAC8FB|nr:centrosomal protein of 97 kDa isoform X2 [Protopterus annectens]